MTLVMYKRVDGAKYRTESESQVIFPGKLKLILTQHFSVNVSEQCVPLK